MDKFLCIDTSIYIQCALLQIDGDNLDTLKKVHGLLDSNSMKLLLPEIIELEIGKVLKNTLDDIEEKLTTHTDRISKDDGLSKKIKEDVNISISEVLKTRKTNVDAVRDEMKILFDHTNTIMIPLTNDIFLNTLRSSISGKRPYNQKSKYRKGPKSLIDQDTIIIQSIVQHVKDTFVEGQQYELYFCTDNINDFGIEDTLTRTTTKLSLDAHEDVVKTLPNLVLYQNLLKLLKDKFNIDYTKEDIQKMEAKSIELNISEAVDIQESIGTENVSPSKSMGTAEVTPDDQQNNISTDSKEIK